MSQKPGSRGSNHIGTGYRFGRRPQPLPGSGRETPLPMPKPEDKPQPESLRHVMSRHPTEDLDAPD